MEITNLVGYITWRSTMAISIFLSITIILLISFVAIKNNLHLFEMIFIWMVMIIIHHNFFTVVAVNMKMYDFAEHPAHYWTLVFNRVFLLPLLIIWYFDRTLPLPALKKWMWLPVIVAILIGVEYLAEVLKVFEHTRWKRWWSIIEWLAILLAVYLPWIWFRKLLGREMK